MRQDERAWAFEFAITCGVPAEFAWDFWTDVRNWGLDSDLESVEIDGPFAAGTRGVTNSKSSGRIEWHIAKVGVRNAVIEFPLSGAIGRFEWTFEATAEGVRIAQRCTLQGEQAYTYVQAVGSSLESGVPGGMKKLCEAMEDAARR